ncbi:Epoxide hydrolase 4 [Pleurostoma richardsiae]|uniref:Epoxide hydrolase 4 n=1 Tax=Pleurostoma richardsiae TaxID=41990 RepID=A0AA38VVR6_9PEZI|nr:Epoxide hydrolase 4 [Pleurostoma richardsiae]
MTSAGPGDRPPEYHGSAAMDDDDDHKLWGKYLEYSDHPDIFVPHAFPEQIVDLGEIRMNYAVAGEPSNPALLLVPGQTESWWGYEDAIHLLSKAYRVYAVDLRGQGRSTWTPGRYSIDLFGNDLVRFIDRVIGRPVVVCGLSSGGVISAWLSAFALPGQVLAAVYEDPPLFASQTTPAVGHSIRQTMAGPMFRIFAKYIGPQWSVHDEEAMGDALMSEVPSWMPKAIAEIMAVSGGNPLGASLNLKEYDPEWGDAFWTGRATINCDHEAMLKQVKVPVLFTHHFRKIDPDSGNLVGALSDIQAKNVQRLVEGAGRSFTYKSFPTQPHSMHGHDPVTYVTAITEWFASLGLGPALHPTSDQIPAKEKKPAAADTPGVSEAQSGVSNLNVAPEEQSSSGGEPGNPVVDGVWDLTVKAPGGKIQKIKLTLKSSGTSLSGSLDGDEGINKFDNGKVEGSSITFRAQLTRPFKVKVNYKATIDGNKITGQAKAAMLPPLRFSGARAP